MKFKVIGCFPYLPMWEKMVQPAYKCAEYPAWRHQKGSQIHRPRDSPLGIYYGGDNQAKIKLPMNNAFRNVEQWIADSGSGHDFIATSDVANKKRIRQARVPMTFFTANGVTHTGLACGDQLTLLGQKIAPFVLDGTPPVLSIGAICMKFGYQFQWPAFGASYCVTPGTMVIRFEVDQDIPFLNEHVQLCQPVDPNCHVETVGPDETMPACPNAQPDGP